MFWVKRLEEKKQLEEATPAGGIGKHKSGPVTKLDPYQPLKQKIHQKIVDELGSVEMDRRQLEEAVTHISSAAMDAEPALVPRFERTRIISEIIDEVLGLGPIEPLLKDDTVTEVMVNRYNQVYVERNGLLVLTDVHFRDDIHVMHIIEKIVSPLGRRID